MIPDEGAFPQLETELGSLSRYEHQAEFFQQESALSIDDTVNSIVEGLIDLPIIYKPNSMHTAKGLYLLDGSKQDGFSIVLPIGTSDGPKEIKSYLLDFLKENNDGIVELVPGCYNINLSRTKDIKTLLHKVLLYSLVPLPGFEDFFGHKYPARFMPGMFESYMKTWKTSNGLAFETRHDISEEDDKIIVKDVKRRIGATTYFSNYNGFKAYASIDSNDIYGPLADGLMIQKDDLKSHVHGILKETFQCYKARLSTVLGIPIPKLSIRIDVQYKQDGDHFPSLVLIESETMSVTQ